jgi:NitT/TauT family transport system substrate-binding protein
VPADKVGLQDHSVSATLRAVKGGSADAAVMYQPHLAQLRQEMGNQVQVFFGEDVYAFRFLLVAKNDYISQHPQEIQRVLRALVAAVVYIKAQPQEARHIVAQAVKIDETTLAQVFDPQDYVISLDQALLTALEDQTRWAMQRGTTPKRPMPNFLNSIRHHDLKAVKPSAVRLVH